MISLEAYTRARLELEAVSRRDIDAHTAEQWAARAVVAFEEFHRTKLLTWLLDAIDYEHEALEHAAVGGTFESIRTSILNVKRTITVQNKTVT